MTKRTFHSFQVESCGNAHEFILAVSNEQYNVCMMSMIAFWNFGCVIYYLTNIWFYYIRCKVILFLNCSYQRLKFTLFSLILLSGDVLDEKNQMEFKALEKLHIHLDDDKNGDVDFSESKEVG
jgi:hypothetical protein